VGQCASLIVEKCGNCFGDFSLTRSMNVTQAQGSMLRRAALGTAFLFATAMVQPALADDEEPGESVH